MLLLVNIERSCLLITYDAGIILLKHLTIQILFQNKLVLICMNIECCITKAMTTKVLNILVSHF